MSAGVAKYGKAVSLDDTALKVDVVVIGSCAVVRPDEHYKSRHINVNRPSALHNPPMRVVQLWDVRDDERVWYSIHYTHDAAAAHSTHFWWGGQMGVWNFLR